MRDGNSKAPWLSNRPAVRLAPPSKTGRRRGAVLARIRLIAALGFPFSVTDLPLPTRRGSLGCQLLAHLGELTVLRPGRPGRFGGAVHAIYQKTSSLRLPSPPPCPLSEG